MPASPYDVSWLPPLEEKLHTEVTVKLHDNKARKGDKDFGAPGATPGHGLPKDADYEKKHPRGGKGTREGGKFVRKGDSGSQVETVQQQLGLQVDGRYDAGTASAVLAFQQRHGLEADGVIGRQTALALTGQFSRARKVGPGPLGPYTSKLVGGDSKPRPKGEKKKKAKRPAERVGGGLLVAGEDSLPFVAENVTDHLGNVHDLLGKFAPKLGGKGGGHHAAAIPEYDPKNLKFGKLAGGSNGARIATHADGSKWLVKTYQGGENRVATELLANAVYRDLGARVPRAGRIRLNNGKQALAYPLLEGKPKKGVFQRRGATPDPEIGKHFMTDALLANWDVAGLEDDNILWDPQGNPFRVDQGGTLEYRAMGGTKPFGPIPYEVTTMLTGSGQSRRSAAVDPQGLLTQARQIAEQLTPARVDQLVDAAGFKDKGMRERVRKTLKARVAWMGRFAQGVESLPAPPGPPTLAEAFWLEEAYTENFDWKELLHPRDAHGKFIEKIAMSGGVRIQLDEKTFIQRDKDGTFRVTRSGGITKGFTSPEDAARKALDASVKSKDHGSVGGSNSYSDFNAYLQSRLGKFGADKTITGGLADAGHVYFGGKKRNFEQMELETVRLQQDLAAAQASSDKYVQRQVPTLESRLKEARTKYQALGGKLSDLGGGTEKTGKTPILGSAQAAAEKVVKDLKPGTTFVNTAGVTLTISKNEYGKLHITGGNLGGSGVVITYEKAATSILANSWKDFKPPQGSAIKGAKVEKKDLGDLPVGTVISMDGVGASWTKESGGGWKAQGSGTVYPASAFGNTYTVTKVGDGQAPASGYSIGGHKVSAGDAVKVGATEYTVKAVDAQQVTLSHANGLEWKYTHGDLADYFGGSLGAPWVHVPKGAAKPAAKPGKKVSGPQENKLGANGNLPAMLKLLDISEGDVIQPSGSGGWKYTVTAVHPSGAVVTTGPKGGYKTLSAYSKPKLITKKDKTPLALKAADPNAAPGGALPGVAASATDLTPLDIKAKLEDPGTNLGTMGSLPEGTVIQTPDGKVAVLKPSEPAYSGYVSAYDISTGQKFEPPADKKPTKVSLDANVVAAASAALAKVHGQTKVTSAASPKTVTHDVGPPAAFDGIASWHSAKPHIPDATAVNLTAQERQAITDYTGSGYGPINGILRNSKSVADLTWAKSAAAIKKALRKGVVKEDVWIGRQTNNDTWKTEAVAGKVIQDNGVMSSSTTQGVWDGNVYLNVLIRKGSNALHVKSISGHPGEDEVLMPPGSMFHVLKREEKGGQTVLYVEMIT